MRLLHESFESTAQRLAPKCALVCADQRVSYGELLGRVRALCRALQDAGVNRGDRVLIMLENGVDYVVAVHAVLMAGAVMVPLSPTTKAAKFKFIAADTGAVAVLVHRRLVGSWRPAWDAPNRTVRVCLLAGPSSKEVDPEGTACWPAGDRSIPNVTSPCIDQDLAALIYTSGTTGNPKGVMLSHLNMVSAWRSVQAYLGLVQDDVLALPLSPTFSYGLYNLLMGLGVGATVVIETQVAFPAKLARTLEEHQATVLPGVPTLFAGLLGMEHFSSLNLPHLRLVTNAAAPLPIAHIAALRKQWPHAQLLSMYGLTECKRVSYLSPEDLDRYPGSVGRGMPHQECWLVDDDGRRLGAGATGELVVRGSHVMRGYWNRPAETAERLRPGPMPGEFVLHTGDIFRSNEDGYLYFVARRDDIIKSRGEKVAPREVEDVIHRLHDVVACAVVGVPDELLGQAIKACVVLKPNATLGVRDVVRHCQALLEPHMVPKHVEFLHQLPQTESGKIRHASLRENDAPHNSHDQFRDKAYDA